MYFLKYSPGGMLKSVADIILSMCSTKKYETSLVYIHRA